MTRYYLRLVLWTFLVLVASILLVIAFFAKFQERYFRPDLGDQFQVLKTEIDEQFQGKGLVEAREQVQVLGEKMLFDAEIVELSAVSEAPLLLRPSGADYLVALRPNPAKIEIFRREQGGTLLASLLGVAGLIALGGWFMILPLLKRLGTQERAIRRIAEGNLEARVEVKSKDALGQLGNRFNEMADRIQALVARQRELLHAVSHELRTPCARIRFGIELLADADSEEERESRIAALHEDVGEMDSLLEELLLFLRFDDSREALSVEEVGVAELFQGLVDKASREQSEISVRGVFPEGGVVRAHPRYLARVLENLLRNAVRHAESEVLLTGRPEPDGSWVFWVDDDGSGVDEADRERIFEAFEQLDASRQKGKAQGTGLGLAISKRIIERHGGAIEVGESEIGGARFIVRIP